MSSGIEQSENENDVQWGRDKVMKLSSHGYSQREIATALKLSVGIINRDLSFPRQHSRENITKHVGERLPEEYEKCLVGVTSILKEAWMMAQKAQNEREKIQALNLAKECYSMKMDMLTNATVIDDAIRFIAVNTNANPNKKNESKGPDDHVDKDERLTTNQIF